MKFLAATATAVILLLGCTERQPTVVFDEALAKRVTALEERETKRMIARLVDRAQDREMWGTDEVMFSAQGSDGFLKVAAVSGLVLVQLEKVEPYLEGYHVHFRIGNPTMADIAGISGQLKWGPKNGDLHSKKFESPVTLRAGYWTSLRLTTDAVTKGEFERVGMAPEFKMIRLRSE